MIEVRVGKIERHPVTGAPLVALEPRDPGLRTRLVLPLSPAVACSLTHELAGQVTLRATAYLLLGQAVDALGGEVSAVEIVPAANGMAAGRLCINGQTGDLRVPVEIALGIGLAVVTGAPLWVAPELVREEHPSDAGCGADLAARSAVPEAFRRAFQA